LDYESLIRDVYDWPKPGIDFKDITTCINDPAALKQSVEDIAEHFSDAGVTKVMGAEARGFIFGAPVAIELGAGFIPCRKPGKLPWKTFSQSYDLEYGTDTIEIHQDAAGPDDVILLVDDLIATGGTAVAEAKLAQQTGAKIAGFGFLLSLDYLHPYEFVEKELGPQYEIFSLVHVTEGSEE
jgi:adenine phosphoribosyltransferase